MKSKIFTKLLVMMLFVNLVVSSVPLVAMAGGDTTTNQDNVHETTIHNGHKIDPGFELFKSEATRLTANDPRDNFFGSMIFAVDDPYMQVDGVNKAIDPKCETSPVVIDGQLFLPINSIIEKIGGAVFFDADQQSVIINADDRVIELHIGYNEILVNGELMPLDDAPLIINNTLMVSVDVIESLYFECQRILEVKIEHVILTRLYQTKRLIVSTASEMDFSNLDTVEIIKGPDNFVVLQFATIREAKEAHSQLDGLSNVILLAPDVYMPEIAPDAYMPENVDSGVAKELLIMPAGANLGGSTRYDTSGFARINVPLIGMVNTGTGTALLYISCADLCGVSTSVFVATIGLVAGGPMGALVVALGHSTLQAQCKGFGIIIPIYCVAWVPVAPGLWDVRAQEDDRPWRTITWNANGGSVTPEARRVRASTSIGELPSGAGINRGLSFNGWYTAPTGGTLLSQSSIMPNYDVTYYARWVSEPLEREFTQILYGSSFDYHKELAIMSVDLSNAAYDVSAIKHELEQYKFANIVQKNYDDAGFNWKFDNVAHTFGRRDINGFTIVVITIRGTAETDEWVSNFMFPNIGGQYQHPGFTRTMEKVYENLKAYMGGVLPTDGNTKYLITGHSRGAAVANLLSVQLSRDGVAQSDVFNYNFAVPDVAVRWIGSWPSHDNIFNICNENDIVTRFPGSAGNIITVPLGYGWGKFGRTLWWNGPRWEQVGFVRAHEVSLYSQRVNEYMPPGAGLSNVRKFMAFITAFKCPVDIQVYDNNGIHVASIENNEITYYNSTLDKLQIFIYGDTKNIIFLDNMEYTLHINGADTGTLIYTAAVAEVTDDVTAVEITPDGFHFEIVDTLVEIIEQKIFSDVEIYDGKQMISIIDSNADVSDVKLILHIDGVNVGEVLENGNEQMYEYLVSFVDWNGDVLCEQVVKHFNYPKAPTDPERYGYIFIGWDTNFNYPNYIRENKTITALYEINDYTITPTIHVTNATRTAGEEIPLTISLENNPGIASYSITMHYPNTLTYVSVTSGDIITSNFYAITDTADQVTVTATSPMGTDVSTGTVLFTLTFKINNDLDDCIIDDLNLGYYNINLDGIEHNTKLYPYPIVTQPEITVKKITYGDVNRDGTINMLDVTRLLRYIWNIDRSPDSFSVVNANVNGDENGTINMLDVTRLLRYIWNIDKSPLGPKMEPLSIQRALFATYSSLTDPLVSVSSASGYVGDEVTLMVSLENNPGIASYYLTMQYPDTLSYVTAAPGDILTSNFYTMTNTAGQVTVTATSPMGTDVSTGTVLFTLTFKIKEGASAGVIDGLRLDYFTAGLEGIEHNAKLEYYKINQGTITVETVETVTYTVTYNANGGTNTPFDSNSPYPAGIQVTVLGQGSMIRDSFTFNGWAANSTTGMTYQPSQPFTIAGNTVFYAVWTENPTYLVSYDANGGLGAPTGGQYEQGVAVVVSSVTPTRPGYTFAGWFYNGVTYTAGQTFRVPVAGVTLTAQWVQNPLTYTVTYNANGGTDAPASSQHAQGTTVTVPSGVPTRSDYTFNSWLYSGNTYTNGQTFTMPANNLELTAQWTQNPTTYKVSYDANGGLGAPTDSNLYAQGTSVTVSNAIPTRSGYTFNGWTYGGNTYHGGQSLIVPTTDVTLTAQWTENPTSNNSDGGGGTTPRPTITPKPTIAPTPVPSESVVPPSEVPTPSEPAQPVDEGFPLWGIAAAGVIAVIAGIAAAVLCLIKKPKT